MKSSLVLSGLLLLCPGCAIKYYDQDSGTYHLWGLGHVRIKSTEPREGARAVIVGEQLLGLGIRADRDEKSSSSVSLGYSSRNRMKIMDDTSVRLEWGSNSLFDVDIGSLHPLEINYGAGTENPD